MNQLNSLQMEIIIAGRPSRTNRNLGCAAMGLAAGLAVAPIAPFIGGLTTLGCMLITPYE